MRGSSWKLTSKGARRQPYLRGVSSCGGCAGWRSVTLRFAGSSSAWGGAEKRSVGASERDEFLRAAWRLMVAGQIDAERLVFVEECSTNTSLAPLYAWSPKGERAFCSVPRNWGVNITLVASMNLRGMGECLAVEGQP
jgi:hypothetical protein